MEKKYKEVTPKNMRCTLYACPQIHEEDDNYIIIGKQVDPASIGLEKKVGPGEVAIRIPKKYIDERER